MFGNTLSIHLALSLSVVLPLLAGGIAQAGQPTEIHPRLVEVFTTAELPVSSEAVQDDQPRYREIDFQVFELDGIWSIEAKLSEGLTTDPEQSKQDVLQRFQQLQEEDRIQMQRAAMGLAKASQYGIDRYPAIVFNGGAVVYGVTDIREAFRRYHEWREGGKQ